MNEYWNDDWNRLHNEEPLFVPKIVWILKFSRLRWAGQVGRLEEDKSALQILAL